MNMLKHQHFRLSNTAEVETCPKVRDDYFSWRFFLVKMKMREEKVHRERS